MQETFELSAEVRTDLGKGASRRLRHANKIPAIMYGGDKDPQNLCLAHNELALHLENEAFYSHILTINVDGQAQKAVLRDLQRHPSKPFILHADFLRVKDTDVIHMRVPLHFLNEESAHGVKMQGGLLSRTASEVEISCQAQKLPEYIEVDVKDLKIGESIHMSDLQLPAGVELVELSHGAEHDQAIVSIYKPRAASVSDEAGEVPAGEVPTAGEEAAEGGEES